MSKAATVVRYDGPVLADHQMDVADLAPALLGLSELCKIANAKANGNRTAVKVLINTDLEHQCFQFSLQVVQTTLDFTKSILGTVDLSTAEDILKWLGIGSGSTLSSVWGLLKFLKWLRGRKITSTKMITKDGSAVTQVTVTGNNNNIAIVHPQVMNLVRDKTILSNVKKVIEPVTKDGYELLEFDTPAQETITFTKEEAIDIAKIMDSGDIEEPQEDKPQIIEAWIKVYAPVYDPKASRWRFYFGNEHHYMDISETEIAARAIERGGALINDAYHVRLEITQAHRGGEITNSYRIKEVLEFKPSQIAAQPDMFANKPSDAS